MVTKEYKQPDVKAPRFRQEAVNIIDDKFLKAFKEKYPKYKNLTKTDAQKIIKYYNETVWKEVLETRDGAMLPENLGVIFIGTCRSPMRQNIDYVKSKKYGVTVTNKNWDTDGRLAKIFFTSYSAKYRFKNRECWGFVACRNFKRSLAKVYPENWNMYIQIDPTKKLKETYKKKIYSERKKSEALKDYNEFDL